MSQFDTHDKTALISTKARTIRKVLGERGCGKNTCKGGVTEKKIVQGRSEEKNPAELTALSGLQAGLA